MSEGYHRELPIGLGKEAISKESLPAVEVDNRVLWYDTQVESPFRFKKGKSTRLGVFLTQTPDSEQSFNLKVRDEHWRTGMIGQIVFRDKKGIMYRDIDIKGLGHLRRKEGALRVEKVGAIEGKRPNAPQYSLTGSYGILDESFARQDINMSRKLRSAGIRTYRPLALITLNEIVDPEGKKISIAEAKQQKLILPSETPVAEVRAYGTRNRIGDLKGADGKILLEDARLLVAQEFGFDEKEFTKDAYALWFAKTLGVNIGKLHAAQYAHGYLTDHNITLDCRIVDLDSVSSFHFKSEKEQRQLCEDDLGVTRATLEFFFSMMHLEHEKKYIDAFYEEYRNAVSATTTRS